MGIGPSAEAPSATTHEPAATFSSMRSGLHIEAGVARKPAATKRSLEGALAATALFAAATSAVTHATSSAAAPASKVMARHACGDLGEADANARTDAGLDDYAGGSARAEIGGVGAPAGVGKGNGVGVVAAFDLGLDGDAVSS